MTISATMMIRPMISPAPKPFDFFFFFLLLRAFPFLSFPLLPPPRYRGGDRRTRRYVSPPTRAPDCGPRPGDGASLRCRAARLSAAPRRAAARPLLAVPALALLTPARSAS